MKVYEKRQEHAAWEEAAAILILLRFNLVQQSTVFTILPQQILTFMH